MIPEVEEWSKFCNELFDNDEAIHPESEGPGIGYITEGSTWELDYTCFMHAAKVGKPRALKIRERFILWKLRK